MKELYTNNYKIGVTKQLIEERKKQLQTGNSNEIDIVTYYETELPYKLEKMLHNFYRKYNIDREWFLIEEDETIVEEFQQLCDKYNNVIEVLKEHNPFFK